jgi:uncharacterized Zn finger protein
MARRKETSQRDDVRTFPALTPTPGRRGFAESWWGKAWITALEETSMDHGRLSRGRTYARRGAVGEITISPGKIMAKVHGSRPRPYTSTVHIRVLKDGEWDKLLDAVAAKALHLAALLDRDMPQGLVDDAADAGVHLLPHGNELEPECSCPDWGHPCKHAAALCYQVSRILDEDPFVLLLMRGRDEPAIMAELHRRNAVHAAAEQVLEPQTPLEPAGRAPDSPRGTPAREAFAAWTPQSAPFALPDPVDHAGPPAALVVSDEPAGIDGASLELLVADAAVRAKALLGAYVPEGALVSGDVEQLLPALDTRRDAIRLLAGDQSGNGAVAAHLTRTLGAEPAELARSIQAWRFGGGPGLTVLEEPWTPSSDESSRARAALAAGWDGETPPAFRTWRNRWTFAELDSQLRLGRDGRWYPYRRSDGDWSPAGAPNRDPAAVLAELLDQAPGQAAPAARPRSSSRSR